MKAQVEIRKSFDEYIRQLSKEYEDQDFEEFFTEEGQYLDMLSRAAKDSGFKGDEFTFTVTYTVTVTM